MKEVTKEECEGFLDAVSKEIFKKDFSKTDRKQRITLKLNLIMRKNSCDDIEEENVYDQLINYLISLRNVK